MAQSVVRLRMVWQNKVKKGGGTMATNKSLSRRTIFLLAAAILYLMIPQNATMPMPEEAVFPFSLLSLSQIARVFAFRQWIAMDLILFHSSAGHHAADPWKA